MGHLSLLGCGTDGLDKDSRPMRIVITSDRHDKLVKAKELTEDLVSSVNERWRERTQRLQNRSKASDGKGGKGSQDNRKGKAAYINLEKERLNKEAENRKQQAEDMHKEIEKQHALVTEKKRMLQESADKALQVQKEIEKQKA